MADRYRVSLDAVTRFAEAVGGGSRIGTTVRASARAIAGTGTGPVACASTGALEARIATMVAERLRGG